MKTLTIGFLVFLGWSALSTYFYVCKIKGLCSDRETVIEPPSVVGDLPVPISSPVAEEKKLMPDTITVFFGFDKSDFASSAITASFFEGSNAYILKNPAARLTITGHTDAVGTDMYNQDLGLRRAKSVQSYFESRGIAPGRILTDSRGENEPAFDNNSASGRSKNRKAVITIKN